MSLRVGVLAVQGAVSEHEDALRRAAAVMDREVDVVAVRTAADLASVSGIVLPGGESTTISRLLRSGHMQDDLVRRAGGSDPDLAVFGTCAGMILVCRSATHDVEEKDIELLGLLDAVVDRNAFGRQRESFEAVLDVAGIGPMPTVFIRAPALESVGDGVEVLARVGDGRIVAARQGGVLATAFHPELTPATGLHERFLDMAQAAADAVGQP